MSGPLRGCPLCGGAGFVELAVAATPQGRSCDLSCPECCGPSPLAIEQWRSANGWVREAAGCCVCSRPTHLRGPGGLAAHLHCRPLVGAMQFTLGGRP